MVMKPIARLAQHPQKRQLPAEAHHRVEGADHFDRGACMAEAGAENAGHCGQLRRLVIAPDEVQVALRRGIGTQQPDPFDQASQRTRRKGPPRIADQKDPVPRPIAHRKPAVGPQDLRMHAPAKPQIGQLAPFLHLEALAVIDRGLRPGRAQEMIDQSDRGDPRRIERSHRAIEQQEMIDRPARAPPGRARLGLSPDPAQKRRTQITQQAAHGSQPGAGRRISGLPERLTASPLNVG